MRTIVRHRSAVALSLLLGACSSNTSVVSAWKDPAVPVQHYNKILAVFISKDITSRRTGEDELVRKIPRAVASYTVVPEDILGDGGRAKIWVTQQGFDALVLMRPVAVDKETSYVPGTSTYAVPYGYGSAWGYWGTGWGAPYDPGHYRQDQVVYVETNVYALSDTAKLVWSSRTKSYNPENAAGLVSEIVDQSVAEMKKQNVIASGV